MNNKLVPIAVIATMIIGSTPSKAETPSAFGSGFDVQDFYKPFTLEEITPENQQKWPYYKYVSANWDDYAIHGTTSFKGVRPARLIVATDEIDLISMWNFPMETALSKQCNLLRLRVLS